MTDERRGDPRFMMLAQVEVKTAREPRECESAEILEARNLSEGGLFLAVRADACPWLVPDAVVSLAIGIVDLEQPKPEANLIHAIGRVAWRVAAGEASGAGVAFESLDDDSRAGLRALLARLGKRR